MGELIPNIAIVGVFAERDVPCTADWVRHLFRTDRPEFVSEADVDVVEEPGTVRAVMLIGVERLHDILIGSVPVFGDRRQES